MDIKSILNHIEANIVELEKQIYDFEAVQIPRHEADKKLLDDLRSQALKVEAVLKKRDAGQLLTADDIADIPKTFR